MNIVLPCVERLLDFFLKSKHKQKQQQKQGFDSLQGQSKGNRKSKQRRSDQYVRKYSRIDSLERTSSSFLNNGMARNGKKMSDSDSDNSSGQVGQQNQTLIQSSNSLLQLSQLQSQLPQPPQSSYSNLIQTEIFTPPNPDLQVEPSPSPSSSHSPSHSPSSNLTISSCSSSTFYLLHSPHENIYIDNCHSCTMFLPPVFSTIFVRKCKNMKMKIIAQQLRIEDCQKLEIDGIVGVRPVIEGSQGIGFRGLAMRVYGDLLWQMERIGVEVFSGEINQCYDFTPGYGTKKGKGKVKGKKGNFQNLQYKDLDTDAEWEAKIQKNDLDWGYRNVYLAKIIPIKKSLLLKSFPQSQIKSPSGSFSYSIIFTKMQLKQFLQMLSLSLHKNYTIIRKLDPKQCKNILKKQRTNQTNQNYNYKEIFKILDSKVGNWYFLFVRIEGKVDYKGLEEVEMVQEEPDDKNRKKKIKSNLYYIRDSGIIWKLFSTHLEKQLHNDNDRENQR